MLNIKPLSGFDQIQKLQQDYLRTTTAPLDGMWLCGFLPAASHYLFRADTTEIGYCSINDDNHLLQFYVNDDHAAEATALLAAMLAGKHGEQLMLEGAFVSTAEPGYLSLCQDNFTKFEVNALMYEYKNGPQTSDDDRGPRPVTNEELSLVIDFVTQDLDFPEDWLRQYFSNLIQRRELFGYWLNDELAGTGENRKFEDVQKGYTELGVIVGKQHQRKGLATSILREMARDAIANDLQPICSTERENIGAQKAITNAGFIPRNRILHFKK